MEKDDEDTIEVRFVTQLEEYKVTETPFRVLVKFGRYGLSGVINHLLELNPPKPFDFLIGGEFLRTSLRDFLTEKGISAETTLTIEYLEAITEPIPDKDFKHEDWVSAIDGTKQGFYLTGAYDSVARVWNSEGKCLISCDGHTGPIRGLARIQNDDSLISFVTGSKDQSVRVWQADPKSQSFGNTFVGKGHSGAIESVSVSPGKNEETLRFCSGSWDKSIKVWDTEGQQQSVLGNTSKKKRKLDKVDCKDLTAVATFDGHTQCVSSVVWISENRIISGSWDHSIKQWDITNGAAIDTLHGNKVIYGLSFNNQIKLIASAHADKTVRLWDLRSNDAALVLKSFTSHKEWVTSVAWHPNTDHLLVSGSHDGTVKLWDIRSVIPLHTLSSQDKIFCVGWDTQDKILSGGADCKVNVWKMRS